VVRCGSHLDEELPMNEDNPYAPPLSDLIVFEKGGGKDRLADRFTRFTAAILDSIIGLAFGLPVMFLTGLWTYVMEGQNPPLLLMLAGTGLGFVWFLLIHGYLLKKHGQTVGKMLMGIRITDLNGNVPDFAKVILLRYLPISLVSLIPVVESWILMIDVIFIFRSDRRCLHDLLAGTKVLKVKQPG
jgi:uncharacterized RDD family membrane protein YckC